MKYFLFFVIIITLNFISIFSIDFSDYDSILQQQTNKIELQHKNSNTDFIAALDKPKEIEIICKGEAVISIKDLVADTAANYDGECAVIKMKGNNFDFQFSLNCNGEFEKDNFYNNQEEETPID